MKYVNEDILKESFSCALCFYIVIIPWLSPCGQKLCYRCIRLKFGDAKTIEECPLPHEGNKCMKPVGGFLLERHFKLDIKTRDYLLKQPKICPYPDCKETVIWNPREEEHSHIKDCGYAKLTCPNDKCKMEYLSKETEGHLAECSFQEIKCTDCGVRIPRHTLVSHYDTTCTKVGETRCGCGKNFSKHSELRDHQLESPLDACSTACSESTGASGDQSGPQRNDYEQDTNPD